MLNIKSISIAISTLLIIVFAWLIYQQNSKPVAAILQPNNAQMVQTGMQVYGEQCATCHGVKLEGQANWQTRSAQDKLPAPPHNKNGHTWHHKDQLLFDLTKFGLAAVSGSDYVTDMPLYKGILSDDEIVAVLSYIKSTWPTDVREMHDKMNRNSQNK